MSKRIDFNKGGKNTSGVNPAPPAQNFYVPPRRHSAPPSKSAAQGFLVLIGLLVLGSIWTFNFLKDNPAVLIALIASVLVILIMVSVSKKKKKLLEEDNLQHDEPKQINDGKKL